MSCTSHLQSSSLGRGNWEAVRHQMVLKGWVRSNIKTLVKRIKMEFRWGVRKELISGEVLARVQSVEALHGRVGGQGV